MTGKLAFGPRKPCTFVPFGSSRVKRLKRISARKQIRNRSKCTKKAQSVYSGLCFLKGNPLMRIYESNRQPISESFRNRNRTRGHDLQVYFPTCIDWKRKRVQRDRFGDSTAKIEHGLGREVRFPQHHCNRVALPHREQHCVWEYWGWLADWFRLWSHVGDILCSR